MTIVRFSRPLLLLQAIAALPACGPSVELPQGDATTDAQGSTETTGATGPSSDANPTAPPDPVQTSTDPYEPTTSGSSGGSTSWDTDDGCLFIDGCGSETGTVVECDILEQNCPDGEKCAAWANDGGSAWNATRCVPVAPDAGLPGEPCTVEGSSVSGIDSCALASMCWNVDPDTLQGECIGQCTGTWENPTCADPETTCQVSAEGVVNLCHPTCNPVTQADCSEGQGCYPAQESFICAPDASGPEGAAFGECEFVNGCDPGTACVNPVASEACSQDSGGCCLPWCDVNTPNCPGDMVCTPWFEDASGPPGSEFVGLCVDESAAP